MKYLVVSLLSLLAVSFFGQKNDSLKKGQQYFEPSQAILIDTLGVLYEEEIVIDAKGAVQTIIDKVVTIRNELQHGDSSYLEEIILTKYDTLPLSVGVKEVLNDSAYWIAIDSFFIAFDSLRVDPYGYDGVNFKDTLLIPLFDTIPDSNGVQRNGTMPMLGSHYVTSKLDSGKIILQEKVKILAKDDAFSLAKKVLKKEHKLYPAAILKIIG